MKEKLIKFIAELKSLNEHRVNEQRVHQHKPEIKNMLDIKINTTNQIIKDLEKLVCSDDKHNKKVKDIMKNIFENTIIKL